MNKLIYLDNAATERVSFAAMKAAETYAREFYFNPGGRGTRSLAVMKDINGARETLAGILGCAAKEICFMSGATEANNFILRRAVKRRGNRIIISEVEHASVYNTAKALTSSLLPTFYGYMGSNLLA